MNTYILTNTYNFSSSSSDLLQGSSGFLPVQHPG